MLGRVCLLGLAIVYSVHAENGVGTVLQVRGTWYAERTQNPLSPGTEVRSGAVIKADPDAGVGLVVIALPDETTLHAACPSRPCDAHLQVPNLPAQTNVKYQAILQAVKSVLLNATGDVSESFEPASARGIVLQRKEALVRFTTAKPIPLDPYLDGLPANRYHVIVRRVGDSQFLQSDDIVLGDNTSPPQLTLPEPGIYTLQLTDPFGSPVSEIALAALDQATFEASKAGFAEAQSITKHWTGTEASSAAHLFVRAYLLSLVRRHEP